MHRTKIVATIGPASEQQKKLEQMIAAGMSVARLNFSHGTYAQHKILISHVRGASRQQKKPVAIMQDLQGPRIRVGNLPTSGLELVKGQEVILVAESSLNLRLLVKGGVFLPVEDMAWPSVTQARRSILINDGLVELAVVKIEPHLVHTRVVKGGVVFSHKGINIPGVELGVEVITKKDRQDLAFGLTQGVDMVALSFVRSAADIVHVRKLMGQRGRGVQVIAKIERREAVKNFDKILAAADGIMVARGDLGLELPSEDVPIIQKQIVAKCVAAAKPVIVATQMLESMILNPRPTRAEVSDVANAVIDHADALMLSGETAYGQYPVESISMMQRVIHETEQSPFDDYLETAIKTKLADTASATAAAAAELTLHVKAKAILVLTRSGHTAREVSSFRPETSIIALTSSALTQRQLQLSWGVTAAVVPTCRTLDELIKKSLAYIKVKKLARAGDRVIIVTGHPLTGEHMNLVKVQTI